MDVATAANGDVYVADAMSNSVRIFSRNGDFIDEFGREGGGPLEFREPVALGFAPAQQVVLAARTGVKVFTHTDGMFQLLATVPVGADLPISPSDMCVAGGTIYVRATSRWSDEIIYAFETDGSPVSAFGKGYEAGGSMARSGLSVGPIVCAQDPPGVVVAFMHLPIVQFYNLDGSLRWTSYLAEFTPVEAIEYPESGALRTSRSAANDIVHSAVLLPPDRILIEVLRLAPGEEVGGRLVQRGRRRDVFLISAETGFGEYIGSDLPSITHADDELIWTVEADSALHFPRVVGLRYVEP